MSEFKGTKGKWTIDEINRYSRWINIKSDSGKKIGEAMCGNENHPDRQEAESNALLISKAPEMLESLQDFINAKDEVLQALDHANDLAEDYKHLFENAERIIKEATELK